MDVCVRVRVCVMHATCCNQDPSHSFYTHLLQRHLPLSNPFSNHAPLPLPFL